MRASSSSSSTTAPTASTSSRVGVRKFGSDSISEKSIAACKASFTANGAEPLRTLDPVLGGWQRLTVTQWRWRRCSTPSPNRKQQQNRGSLDAQSSASPPLDLGRLSIFGYLRRQALGRSF